MRKILIISTMETTKWGGSEVLWYETAKSLSNMDIETVACVQNWKPLSPNIMLLKKQYNVKILLRNGTSQIIAEQLVKEQNPSLVMISLGNSLQGSIWSHACRIANIPYVLIVHYAAEWEFPHNDIFEQLKLSYSQANHVFFVSQKLKLIVEKQVATDFENNSSIITCPCNIPFNINLPFPSIENGLRLACVARLEPKDKGQDLIISVLAQEKWRNRPIKLSLYGNGEGEKLIKSLISYYGLASVELLGFVSDVKQIWKENHILLLPSRAEGKPLSLMEAMLCGRVPAVTNVAGNTELVSHMHTGFVADFPRFECVDMMLENVWQNRHLLQIIGKQAQVTAREKLDPISGQNLAIKLNNFCDLHL